MKTVLLSVLALSTLATTQLMAAGTPLPCDNAVDMDICTPTPHEQNQDALGQEMPHKVLRQIAIYLDKSTLNSFRRASKTYASIGLDGVLLKARGTKIAISSKKDLPTLAGWLKKGKCMDVPIICSDYTLENNDLIHLSLATHVVVKLGKISDEGLAFLTNAETLDLSWSSITDNGLVHLKNIKVLDLSCCQKVTNKGLALLSHATTVGLSGCHQITDEGLDHLTNTTTLELSGCINVTQAAKDALRARGVQVIG